MNTLTQEEFEAFQNGGVRTYINKDFTNVQLPQTCRHMTFEGCVFKRDLTDIIFTHCLFKDCNLERTLFSVTLLVNRNTFRYCLIENTLLEDLFHCDNCGDYSEDKCSFCNTCLDCHSCRECGECGDTTTSLCVECHPNPVCSGCCSCGAPIEFFTNETNFFPAPSNERKINASKRFVAVEIEVAKIEDSKSTVRAVQKWEGSIVQDGSLPETGFEINTSPASGDLYIKQVTQICNALEEGGAKVTASCGLHVHVDARDMTYYDIRRLVWIYAEIESALFDMVPPSRQNSSYCTPCGHKYLRTIAKGKLPHKENKKNVTKAVYGTDITKGLRDDKYNGARYSALNLHSWFYRGTIECRLFNGTINAEKIICWGMLWARIADFAAQATDDETRTFVEQPLTGYEKLLQLVANCPKVKSFIEERTEQHGRAS